jgi:hypothetical protein
VCICGCSRHMGVIQSTTVQLEQVLACASFIHTAAPSMLCLCNLMHMHEGIAILGKLCGRRWPFM